MPIYEYACSSCGFEKDYLQKMSDPLLTEYPQCHQSTLYKKLSAPGFQLKGSGWYATDFKGTGSAPGASKAAGNEKESTEKTATDNTGSEVKGAQTTSSSDTASSAATSSASSEGTGA